MLSWLSENWPLLLAGLYAAERLADVIAHLTKTKADDALVAKFHAFLSKLASLGFKPAAK